MKKIIFVLTASILSLVGLGNAEANTKADKLANLEKYDEFVDFVHKEIKSTRKFMTDCESVDILKYYLLGRLECLYDAALILEGFSPEHFKSLPLDQQRYIINKLDQKE